MNSARSGAAVTAASKYIYALGGYNGTTQLSSVERYDPVLDEWSLVSNMLDHRSALSVASYENKLYVFGGYDGEKFHDTVEVYDCERDRWEVVASMSMGRSGAAVVVGVRPAF
jgi:N-acetylneuraminic acid mutarotase